MIKCKQHEHTESRESLYTEELSTHALNPLSTLCSVWGSKVSLFKHWKRWDEADKSCYPFSQAHLEIRDCKALYPVLLLIISNNSVSVLQFNLSVPVLDLPLPKNTPIKLTEQFSLYCSSMWFRVDFDAIYSSINRTFALLLPSIIQLKYS